MQKPGDKSDSFSSQMMRRICSADFTFPREPPVSEKVKDLLKKVCSWQTRYQTCLHARGVWEVEDALYVPLCLNAILSDGDCTLQNFGLRKSQRTSKHKTHRQDAAHFAFKVVLQNHESSKTCKVVCRSWWWTPQTARMPLPSWSTPGWGLPRGHAP